MTGSTTLTSHEHEWREVPNNIAAKTILKEEICDCGYRKFTNAESKTFYFGGYLGSYGPLTSITITYNDPTR